jgi:hypothetical protein
MRIKERLASRFPDYRVETGKSILYKIEVDAFGNVTHDSVNSPARGQLAFQTDVLITNASLPLVVIELKVAPFRRTMSSRIPGRQCGTSRSIPISVTDWWCSGWISWADHS